MRSICSPDLNRKSSTKHEEISDKFELLEKQINVVSKLEEKVKQPDNVRMELLKDYGNDLKLDDSELQMLSEIQMDPVYFDMVQKFELKNKFGDEPYKVYSQEKIKERRNLNLEGANKNLYFDYKKEKLKQFAFVMNERLILLKEEIKNASEKKDKLQAEHERLKFDIDIMVRLYRGQSEISSEDGPSTAIDEALLIDKNEIDIKNNEINLKYGFQKEKERIIDNEKKKKDEAGLKKAIVDLEGHIVNLKLNYLKHTKVTKRIQEIVMGREDVQYSKIQKDFELKKENLENNKVQRLKPLELKLRKIKMEIDKKERENENFLRKKRELDEEVQEKLNIVELDDDNKNENYGDKNQPV